MNAGYTLPFLAGILVAAALPANEDGKKDIDLIQGEWALTSWESKTYTLDKEQLKKSNMIISGDEWQPTINGRKVEKLTVKLNAAKDPKEIEFVLAPNLTLKGIYKADKDTLIVCRATKAGGNRPKEFKAGENGTLIVLKRPDKK